MKREQLIINILLGLCICLGLIALTSYLSERIGHAKMSTPRLQNEKNNEKTSLADVIDLKPLEPEKKKHHFFSDNGFIARFVPEKNPLQEQTLSTEDIPQAEESHFSPQESPEAFQRYIQSYTFPSSWINTYTPSAKGGHKSPDWTKVPDGLKTEVTFWKDIYARYTNEEVVIHDSKYLDIIYTTLNLSSIYNKTGITELQRENEIEESVEAAKNKIKASLKKLSSVTNARELTADEWVLWKLFKDINEENKFEAARQRVRAQSGLKNIFKEGLEASSAYLGEIENLFSQEGLPPELSRLVFVESLFNLKAHSSAGAKGVWQFMEGSAKFYNLKNNHLADERLDPILATKAAIKLLRDNFEMLGTWPTAINAYNSGRGRLRQATQTLGTNDITRIIKEFKHPKFGFASRNFFPSFLAAYDICENYRDYFGNLEFQPALSFDLIETDYNIKIPDASLLSAITLAEVKTLNPALRPEVFSGEYYLPMGFPLRLPKGKGEQFLKTIPKVPSSHRKEIVYKAKGGENLRSIAKAYGISEESLKQANKGVHKIQENQEILIPRKFL